jgi:hypothetical protein
MSPISSYSRHGERPDDLLEPVTGAPMPRISRGERRSSNRDRQSKSGTENNVAITHAPNDLVSLVRGLYGRVASQLGVDPSYVSRVARMERRSEAVEGALRRELKKIVENISKRRGGIKQGSFRKKQKESRNKKVSKKVGAKPR